MLLLPLALAGCAGQGNPAFAPPCPQPAILPDGADLSLYRGGGTDRVDLVEQAKITGISGSCKAGPHDTTLVSVQVRFSVLRGPAATDRKLVLPWFLAVMKGTQILDRKGFTEAASFPSGAEEMQVESQAVELALPTPKGITAADYRVVTGLQLTPAQLAHNRAALSGQGQ